MPKEVRKELNKQKDIPCSWIRKLSAKISTVLQLIFRLSALQAKLQQLTF